MIDASLMHGDCIELMKEVPDGSVDLVLADPPYGTTACTWDSVIPFDAMWEQLRRICKKSSNIVLFSSGIFTIDLICSNRGMFKYRLVWEKNVPTGMASAKYRPMKYYEEICVFNCGNATYNPIMKKRVGSGKSCYNYDHYCGRSNHISLQKVRRRYDPDWVQPSDLLRFDVVPNRSGKLHPTQKPVDLLEYLIKTYTSVGETVLDFTMGSGSTGVACVNTERNFIGIELDKGYFDIAKKRIECAKTGCEYKTITDNSKEHRLMSLF